MKQCRILSTKKLEYSIRKALEGFAEIREVEFVTIQPVPLSKIQPEIHPWLYSSERLNIAFTSSNAVIDFSEFFLVNGKWILPDWQIFCLSGVTKTAVTEKLFHARIAATADDAATLAKKITEAGVKEIIFFCGNNRRNELPSILEDNGIMVREVVVYESELQPRTVSTEIEAILFFSPSAVESFFSANDLPKGVTCFAIGNTTASAVRERVKNLVIVPEKPSQESMLTAVTDFARQMTM